jgi:hypothetical protein
VFTPNDDHSSKPSRLNRLRTLKPTIPKMSKLLKFKPKIKSIVSKTKRVFPVIPKIYTNKIIRNENTTCFYKCVLHRENGPAVINDEDKIYEWYFNGVLHRENGPAVISPLGKYWYRHGVYHRVDGPAIEFVNGKTVWYYEGKLHREDGPAVADAKSGDQYWIHGVKQSFNDP